MNLEHIEKFVWAFLLLICWIVMLHNIVQLWGPVYNWLMAAYSDQILPKPLKKSGILIWFGECMVTVLLTNKPINSPTSFVCSERLHFIRRTGSFGRCPSSHRLYVFDNYGLRISNLQLYNFWHVTIRSPIWPYQILESDVVNAVNSIWRLRSENWVEI